MKIVPTYTADIYVGFLNRDTQQPHFPQELEEVCQAYCDEVGLCVTIKFLDFVYTEGRECGAVVGLINYPRFPSTPKVIRDHAIVLGGMLLNILEQYKVSIVFPDETIMLERGD